MHKHKIMGGALGINPSTSVESSHDYDYIERMSLLGIIPVKRVIHHNGIIMSYIIRSSYPHFTMESRFSSAASSVTTLLIISKAAKEVNQIVFFKKHGYPYRERPIRAVIVHLENISLLTCGQ